MNSPNGKTKSLLKVIVIVAVGALFLVGWQGQKSASIFYSNALHGANVSEEVIVRGKNYDVVNGKVMFSGGNVSESDKGRALRLAYAKTFARRSPLAALAGTDPERFKIAVNALSEIRDKLSEVQETKEGSAIVKSSLYPIDFLMALANLERARLRFIASGDEPGEKAYKTAERRIFTTYQNDITRFRSSFLRAVSPNVKSFATEGDLISREGMIDALDTLSIGMKKTKFISEKRSKCLRGKTSQCITEDLNFPSIPIPEKQTIKSELVSQAENIRSIFAETMGNKDVLHGPIIAISNGICISDTPGAPLFVLYSKKLQEKNLNYKNSLFIGNIRFIDSNEQRQIKFFKYFADNGIKYVISLPDIYYECPLSGYDFGKVMAISKVIEFSKKSPVSAYAEGETKKRLHKMESSFSSPKALVTERDAVEYILLSRDSLKKEAVPETIYNEIISISLELKNMSAEFESFLLKIYLVERNYLELISKGIPIPLDMSYLYFVRSSAMNLFLSHNSSATGVHAPLFEKSDIPLEKQPFLFYSSMPNTPDIKNSIIKDLEFFYRLNRNLEN